jgi:membrane protease YdiL (CAAX protease family)
MPGSDISAITPQEYDRKWHFVPPAGEKPVYNRWGFLLGILIVLLIEFTLWGIYRKLTAPIYGEGFNLPFFLGHIVAAPTIHLIPIMIYWVLVRKEKFFKKTDKDGDSHTAIELGPFKMTRRLLLTAVLVGLFGGIIWRFTEMMVGDTTSVLMGGGEFGNLHLFNIYITNEFGIFILMTFVMFFIVGPVEEFEFRSFVHDQSARVLPMWKALIFSSMMFGFSHLPIALTIYTQTYHWDFWDVFVAEIGWMTAGATFGALYMWSRNIFACIVMHGIGNWQLSTYYWQSTMTVGAMGRTEMHIASVITAIIANAIMIGIFYLIHKYYWEPQRRGEPAFGGKLESIQKAFFSHDVGTNSPVRTASILSIVSVVTLIILAAGVNVVGTKDLSKMVAVPASDGSENSLSDYTETSETTPVTGELALGNGQTHTIEALSGRLVKSINATLTWTDEPDMRRFGRTYTNQPETFSLSISAGNNLTVSGEGTNVVHESGQIDLELALTEEQILALEPDSPFLVNVTLVESGLYAPRIGVIGYNDDQNSYELSMTTIFLDKKTAPE